MQPEPIELVLTDRKSDAACERATMPKIRQSVAFEWLLRARSNRTPSDCPERDNPRATGHEPGQASGTSSPRDAVAPWRPGRSDSAPAASGSFQPRGTAAVASGSTGTFASSLASTSFAAPAQSQRGEASLPEPSPRQEKAEDEVGEGVAPLKSQSELFGSLWGEEGRTEEAPEQYPFEDPLAAGVPLGPSVRAPAADDYVSGGIYTWSAPSFFHRPLYFEQPNLERYGQGPRRCLQPAASAALFFATIPTLPYHLGAAAPRERVYTLGHYRPGSRAPYQWNRTRFSWRGLLYQGLSTTGTAFVLP